MAYANETNNISDWGGTRPDPKNGAVPWESPLLKRITRLRLLTDPGYFYWDVSYCYGELTDGTAVRVLLPFDRLNKGKDKNGKSKMYADLFTFANADKVNLKRLGVFDAISCLW